MDETFAALWDPGGLPEGRRNLMWLTFADPVHRRTWVEWEDRSRILLAEFRAAAGQHAGDLGFVELSTRCMTPVQSSELYGATTP